LGAAGMGTMVNVVICDSFSMRDRGLYLAVTSGVWAVASAVGPVVGGVFTTTIG
jgi:MFS family permease